MNTVEKMMEYLVKVATLMQPITRKRSFSMKIGYLVSYQDNESESYPIWFGENVLTG